MQTVTVVTGAARGIGLEICRLRLEAGDTVVACPRQAGSADLAALAAKHAAGLHEIPLDVADPASVDAAAARIGEIVDHVDLLVNNAGIYPKDAGLDDLDFDDLLQAFRVNTLGPLRVARALLPLLRKGQLRRLAQITSLMGSIADGSGGSYAYRMSKTALNMAVSNLAHELGREGFVALAIHPGWVRTRMGGGGAPLELGAAAAEVLRIALETPASRNGAFIGPESRILPY